MKLSFIKLDIDIMNDSKIKIIRKLPAGNEMIVAWIGILCLAMKSGTPGKLEIGDNLHFTDETLSAELDVDLNTMRLALKTFVGLKMVEILDNGEMYVTNYEKHQKLDLIKQANEKTRLRVAKSREKAKLLTCNGYSSVTTVLPKKSNGIDIDIDKDLDKDNKKNKIKKTKNFTPPSISEIECYIKEKGFLFEAGAFFDYYESKGWLIGGKSKMKSWESALNNWNRNQSKFGGQTKTGASNLEGGFLKGSKWENQKNEKK